MEVSNLAMSRIAETIGCEKCPVSSCKGKKNIAIGSDDCRKGLFGYFNRPVARIRIPEKIHFMAVEAVCEKFSVECEDWDWGDYRMPREWMDGVWADTVAAYLKEIGVIFEIEEDERIGKAPRRKG